MCSLVANANNIFTTILVISNELSSFPQNATALHTSLNIVALHVIIISTFSVAAEFVPLTLTFSFSTKFITKNKHSSAFTATFCLPPCEYTSWLLKISLHASVTSRKIFVFFSKCKKSDFFSSSLVCVQNCFISSSLVLVLVSFKNSKIFPRASFAFFGRSKTKAPPPNSFTDWEKSTSVARKNDAKAPRF